MPRALIDHSCICPQEKGQVIESGSIVPGFYLFDFGLPCSVCGSAADATVVWCTSGLAFCDGLAGAACLAFGLGSPASRKGLGDRGHLQALLCEPFRLKPAFRVRAHPVPRGRHLRCFFSQ